MDVLTLSRIQFGHSAAFHILWPLMSIGLSAFMLVMEAMWLKTHKAKYYRQLRFWTKIFILTFAIGTASGIPLEFLFGTNWAAFSHSAGDFFGNILGFETTVAFALEAAFLGIFVFGWNRVSPKMHLFSNAMIFVGATLSAFWIMAANSWMQVPRGVVMEGGKLIVTDYMAAIFNPSTLPSFVHMWLACIIATMFLIAGISAAVVLTRRAEECRKFFLTSFKYALVIAAITVPVQLVVGDILGLVIKEHQPAKLAATELHWETNKEGEGAPWAVLALPAEGGGHNSFEIAIPYGLSLITTRTSTGQVQGLNDFAPEDRPSNGNALTVFYSFRIMVGAGILMLILAFWGTWLWKQGELTLEKVKRNRWFWRAFVAAIPLGFIATEAGWMTREIGRQPWIVTGLIRTKEGLGSNLDATSIAVATGVFSVVYLFLALIFVWFVYQIVKKGPDFDAPVPRL